MLCNVNGKIKELRYVVWNGSGYGPDCSYDLLNDGLNQHDDYDRTIYTEEVYENAVEYLKECAEESNSIDRNYIYEACVFSEDVEEG